MKQKLTPQRRELILRSAQIIGMAINIVKVESQMALTDTRFKVPTMNNHVRLIKQSTKAIESHLNTIVYAKDKEEVENDFAVEMHRLFTHFVGYDTEHLKDFNDKIENLTK